MQSIIPLVTRRQIIYNHINPQCFLCPDCPFANIPIRRWHEYKYFISYNCTNNYPNVKCYRDLIYKNVDNIN